MTELTGSTMPSRPPVTLLDSPMRHTRQIQYGDYTPLLDYESEEAFLLFQTWQQALERSGVSIKRASTNPSQASLSAKLTRRTHKRSWGRLAQLISFVLRRRGGACEPGLFAVLHVWRRFYTISLCFTLFRVSREATFPQRLASFVRLLASGCRSDAGSSRQAPVSHREVKHRWDGEHGGGANEKRPSTGSQQLHLRRNLSRGQRYPSLGGIFCRGE